MKKILCVLLVIATLTITAAAAPAYNYIDDGRGDYQHYRYATDGRRDDNARQCDFWSVPWSARCNQYGKWVKDIYGWHFIRYYSDGRYYNIVTALSDLNANGALYQAANGERPFKADGYCRGPYGEKLCNRFIYCNGDIYYADVGARMMRDRTLTAFINDRYVTFSFDRNGALEYYYNLT